MGCEGAWFEKYESRSWFQICFNLESNADGKGGGFGGSNVRFGGGRSDDDGVGRWSCRMDCDILVCCCCCCSCCSCFGCLVSDGVGEEEFSV